jgi:hypothetical protein
MPARSCILNKNFASCGVYPRGTLTTTDFGVCFEKKRTCIWNPDNGFQIIWPQQEAMYCDICLVHMLTPSCNFENVTRGESTRIRIENSLNRSDWVHDHTFSPNPEFKLKRIQTWVIEFMMTSFTKPVE